MTSLTDFFTNYYAVSLTILLPALVWAVLGFRYVMIVPTKPSPANAAVLAVVAALAVVFGCNYVSSMYASFLYPLDAVLYVGAFYVNTALNDMPARR